MRRGSTTWTTYDRPAQYAVVGVVLNAVVRRPDAPGRFPVVVTITPYNGTNGAINVDNDYLVERRRCSWPASPAASCGCCTIHSTSRISSCR